MKSIIQIIIILVTISSCSNNNNSEQIPLNSDQKAIESTILNSYIEGLQNEGDTIKIDAGFHPQFALLGKDDNGTIWALPINEWRKTQFQKVKDGELPLKNSNRVSAEFDFIDVTNDVAVAKLFYYQGGKQVYTDYISLYKFDSTWKIVCKVFTKL
jgi:hypothetical protein